MNPPNEAPDTLRDKVAIVTGSSSGIGQGIAIRLARAGADVTINYHSDRAGGEATRKEVEAAGRRGVLVLADVSQPEGRKEVMTATLEAFGKADILVNNAGVENHAPFLEVKEEDYQRVLQLNLTAVFFLTQLFARHLAERGARGRVINISSVHEDLPFPNFTPYCASKGGTKMFMRTAAIELAPLGITVNNVAPGAIKTPINESLLHDKPKLQALVGQIPVGRMGETADVAGAVAFLASDEASYITGTTIVVDGGLMWNYQEQ